MAEGLLIPEPDLPVHTENHTSAEFLLGDYLHNLPFPDRPTKGNFAAEHDIQIHMEMAPKDRL